MCKKQSYSPDLQDDFSLSLSAKCVNPLVDFRLRLYPCYKLEKVILCIIISRRRTDLNLIIANIYTTRFIITSFTKQLYMYKTIWPSQEQPCEVLWSLDREIGSKELNNSLQQIQCIKL